MKRPPPIYPIHESTRIVRFDEGPTGLAPVELRITRRTANSVFIASPAGELQLDRIALERRGNVKRRGRVYHVKRPGLHPVSDHFVQRDWEVLDAARAQRARDGPVRSERT